MKKIVYIPCIVFISFSCSSAYKYKCTVHTPAVLFDQNEFAKKTNVWDFYVHDATGNTYKGRSTTIENQTFNSVLVERPVDFFPEKLAKNAEGRWNEVHIYLKASVVEENVSVEFSEDQIAEVVSFVSPSQMGNVKNSNTDNESVGGVLGGVLGIIIGGVIGGIILIGLLIEAILDSLFGSIGCYIATMAYGSYDAPEVMVLRRFRDERLKKTFFGRVFIVNYYTFSPLLVKFVRKTGFADRFIRRKLDGFVDRLRTKNNW